ncbi:ABC transporter permease [bacterium]|nr:ABC transporter permease [bacterium]
MRKEAFVGPFVLIVLWQVVSTLGLINDFFLPSPWLVSNAMVQLFIQGGIVKDIGVTFLRLVVGFSIAAVIGVPVGLLMGASRKVCDSLEFLVDFLRSIPGTALIPLFILFLGVGDEAKIAIGAFTAALVIIINSMYGVSHGSRIRRMAALTMKVPPLRRFFQVILPDALPEVFVGLRLGLSTCLVLIIVSEMFLGSKTGLGQRIYDAQLLYRIEEMYCCIILTGVFGYLLNRLAVLSEHKIVHWAGR